ncbi:MAG: helix-turn-helix domain-containing protein [Faecousia sp.]
MKLNEKILQCRKRSGLSQEELADRLGVSRQVVSKWELGTALPELDKLKLLAKTFGVSTDWLLDDEQGIPQEPRQETQPVAQQRSWVEDVPGVIGKLLRRYGWLAGVYLGVAGAAFLGLGALAKFMVGRMFSGFDSDFFMAPEMGNMITNDPVSIMATVIMVVGAVLLVGGIVLAVILKRKGRK